MKFRNYCLVIIGNIKGVIPEIEKISESKVNSLGEKGLLISTFSSNLEPCEITDWFKTNNRNFLVFDLNPENSGFNIMRPDIQEGLFGFLSSFDLEEKAKELLNVIENEKTILKSKKNLQSKELTEEDIKKMKSHEKKEIFDEILDKGINNLTENDKKIIPFLVK